MKDSLRLHVMLSQLLVAFTIEHDNEWEFRYWINADPAPFRTSLVMWANFLRFVREGGITVQDISQKAGYPPGKLHPSLAGMLRWRYVDIDSKNPKKPKPNDIIQLTKAGKLSAEAWKPLVGEIEDRWVLRFGRFNVTQLKQTLVSIVSTFDQPLPHYFPVLDHLKGMRVLNPNQPDSEPPESLALPYLLSQASHLFSLQAEQSSDISLAIRSNVLRVLDLQPTAKKELPRLSGISKEAIAMSLTYLKKHDLALEEPLQTERGKAVRLTDRGNLEKQKYHTIVDSVEKNWQKKMPAKQFADLHSTLESFVQYEQGQDSQLFQGLIPPSPNLWRANVPKPIILPHHPMVLHRGGWPDGS